jgi:hypothetical protein
VTEILARWLASGWHIAIEPTREGRWTCRVREGERSWSVIGTAGGHATPDAALAETDARLTVLVAGREQSRAAEVLGELDRLVASDRLAKREQPGADGELVTVWVATLADRSETEPAPSPTEAARRAYQRERGGAAVGESRINR